MWRKVFVLFFGLLLVAVAGLGTAVATYKHAPCPCQSSHIQWVYDDSGAWIKIQYPFDDWQVFPTVTPSPNPENSPIPTSTPTPTTEWMPPATPVPTFAPEPQDTSVVRMNMKSYANHDEMSYSDTLGSVPYDQRILAIKPEFVIDNLPHGLYGEMDEQRYHENYTYSYLLQDVAGYQAAGIKVIGYISSGYEGKGGDDHYASEWYSLEMNTKLITNMATLDGVDGVFIDEVSDYPDEASKAYLQELSDLAHSYGLIVWMNTGVDDFDEWYFTASVADFMQATETWHTGQPLSEVEKNWGWKIAVTGFSSEYTAQDAYEMTLDAWARGIGHCYINTVEYTKIAPWFERYAEMLRSLNSPAVNTHG